MGECFTLTCSFRKAAGKKKGKARWSILVPNPERPRGDPLDYQPFVCDKCLLRYLKIYEQQYLPKYGRELKLVVKPCEK